MRVAQITIHHFDGQDIIEHEIFSSEDGPEVDILTAARTGFISQGLAIFVLENIRQSRDFIAHGGASRETLRHYLDA